MKSAIRAILDLTSGVASGMAESVVSAVAAVAAYLLATPDPPSDPARPLYLFRGLVNSLRSLAQTLDAVALCRINLAVLKGVCSGAQERLPYHFSNGEELSLFTFGDWVFFCVRATGKGASWVRRFLLFATFARIATSSTLER